MDLKQLVERKLMVLFPDPVSRAQAAKELLRCQKAMLPNIERLELAVLKLFQDNATEISAIVDGAIEDPEDIIGWAERPNWNKARAGNAKLTGDREGELEWIDWVQYHLWLAQGLK